GPYLTDVVEQAGAFCLFDIESKFRGHDGAEVCHLARVLEQVLSVRRTEPHAAHHFDELRVKSVNTQIDHGAFANLDDVFFNVFGGLVYNFLYAGRVYPTILNEAVQRQAGDFATYRVEAGDDDGFRCVVDDDLDAGS